MALKYYADNNQIINYEKYEKILNLDERLRREISELKQEIDRRKSNDR